MKGTVVPAQYLQIALDLAQRIAKGELPEGSRIYGRSVMALSADSARRYIDNFDEGADVHSLRVRLKDLMAESAEVNRQMAETVSALVKSQETFAAADQPLPNYEVPVPPDSPLIGKNIGELKFWQSTGGTIVAIRRGQTVILSPGPYAELYGGDVIILVGSPGAAEATHRLVTTKE